MANNELDRRLLSAADLHDAMNALSQLKGKHKQRRTEFVQNQLMTAIDDICKEHNAKTGTKFSKPQLAILKDCLFQVVYILDPQSRPKQSFIGRLLADFGEQSPLKQAGIIATCVGKKLNKIKYFAQSHQRCLVRTRVVPA